jgi:hypothetical protein
MGEAAVLDLPLADPPILNLTDGEAVAIFKASPTGMQKILDNQASWFGVYDQSKLMQENYKEYLRDIFGRDKIKGNSKLQGR